MALWFHDAVYKTTSGQNERDSADWAKNFMVKSGIDKKTCEKVYLHIMATCHQAIPGDFDSQLMIDIDLAILGQQPDIYDVFEKQVRQEFRWVPRRIFSRKRSKILQSFLAREHIYSTHHFRELYETAARANLARAIDALATSR